MWIADQWQDYELLDCGSGEKLERWDRQFLVRPDPQAIWETDRKHPAWRQAGGRYLRSQSGGGHWEKKALPESWRVHYGPLTFQVKPMNFKHTGLFPEQAVNWDFAMEKIQNAGRPIRVLNLFAYTGGASVACAKAGASVCHVDARGWRRPLSGGSLTTVPSLWSGKSAGESATTPLLWTRPATAGVLAARCGSWRTTSMTSFSSAPACCRTGPCSC